VIARANDAGAYALEVDGLTGPVGRTVIRDVSLRVPRGGTHVVLGNMHAGKSILLRMILGLERAQTGTVIIDGTSFDAASPNERALANIRKRVGVVFDSSALVSRLTLLENVELPLLEHTHVQASAARETAAKLLREVGVDDELERTPEGLSRLDRRRTALARALALRPALLLIDEPGYGLDADAAAELDDRLLALQSEYGCAALICSQEVRYAFRAPNAVSVLAGGTVIDQGELEDLRRSDHESVRRLVDRRGAA
jgi:ABC-type transporter Mla maintaining outer membrane lipid asymmetry ATPase subunit MlaF